MPKGKIKPTVKNLQTYGAEPITRWLIAAAKDRHTLTYTEAKRRLEENYGFSTIFPVMLGIPAGQAMDVILSKVPAAPLLNVLLVRQSDGMPGDGAGPYMADYFGYAWLRSEDARKKNSHRWRKYYERAARDVYNYQDWDLVYEKIYQRPFEPDKKSLAERSAQGGSEKDGLPRGRGGEGENHKNLRLWVQKHPGRVVKNIRIIRSATEVDLLSGDRVDVVVYGSDVTYAVEVKSRDSNDADFMRGIYQCVKYKAVLSAMDARVDPAVISILVTERPLPSDLAELSKRLKVKHTLVSVN